METGKVKLGGPLIKQEIKVTTDSVDSSGKLNKDSNGKWMTYEVDAEFQQGMAKVMSVNKLEFGGKYARGNFRDPINPILLVESLERHLLKVKEAMQKGESLIDETDGCNHLFKLGTNAQMLFVQIKDNSELKKY